MYLEDASVYLSSIGLHPHFIRRECHVWVVETGLPSSVLVTVGVLVDGQSLLDTLQGVVVLLGDSSHGIIAHAYFTQGFCIFLRSWL